MPEAGAADTTLSDRAALAAEDGAIEGLRWGLPFVLLGVDAVATGVAVGGSPLGPRRGSRVGAPQGRRAATGQQRGSGGPRAWAGLTAAASVGRLPEAHNPPTHSPVPPFLAVKSSSDNSAGTAPN